MFSAKAKGPMDDLGLQPHILYTLVNKSARQNTKLTYVHFKTHITIISPHMLKSIKEKSNPIYIYIFSSKFLCTLHDFRLVHIVKAFVKEF